MEVVRFKFRSLYPWRDVLKAEWTKQPVSEELSAVLNRIFTNKLSDTDSIDKLLPENPIIPEVVEKIPQFTAACSSLEQSQAATALPKSTSQL